MKQDDVIWYVALGVGAYVIYKMVVNNPNAETATEAAQSAASTLQANLNTL